MTDETSDTKAIEEPAAPERPVERRLVITSPRRHAVLIAMLVLGAIAVVAFMVLGYRTFTLRLDAARKLDKATTIVQDSDKVVVQIDSVVRAKVAPDLAEKARGAMERVDAADVMLARAVVLIDQARLDLNDDERERADLLRKSATTRRAMLVSAPEILAANAGAASALPLAEEGWEGILEADKLSDRSVSAYNKLTKAGVSESLKLNKEAAGVLSTARERFQSAEKAYPTAPFEDYLDYLDVRIAMNRLSQRSDQAWLDNKVDRTNKIIREYNAEDKKAVELAKKLPATPKQAIADAYAASTKTTTDDYYAAREKVLAADKALRDF